MNCKPGDLAFRVRAPAGAGIQSGAVVRCVNYISEFANVFVVNAGNVRRHHGRWRVEYNGSTISDDGYFWAVPDEDLRPIRGDGLTDDAPAEIDKPHPVEA